MIRFSTSARSDTGLVREVNEDAAFAGPYVVLVADGVGGHAAGEVASATAAYVTSQLLARLPEDPQAALRAVVPRCYQQLAAGVAEQPTREGMATTLTALLAHGDRTWLLHVGDSRAYLLRDGSLAQLTSDHTVVAEMVDAGRLSEAEARFHPYRSVVTRTVDALQPASPDVGELDLRVGDRVLLCSDGLTDLVDDELVCSLLGVEDASRAVAGLVGAALAAGGRDNVTVVVADVVDGPPISGDGALLGSVRDPSLVVDPAGVRLARS